MGPLETNPAGSLVEPLTRREREILTLLAQSYSAPEIAEKLALSSVKWHTQQVYGKSRPQPKRRPWHNLPVQIIKFFGRDKESAQVR